MTAPVVEETNQPTEPTEPQGDQGQQGAEDASVSKPDNDEGQLSEYWRGELSRARGEAASYRTQLRDTQDKLKEAKSPEEHAAALSELQTKLAEVEAASLKTNVALKHNLPEALVARLQGNTFEELEADAKTLAALLKPAAPAPRPGGGLTPGQDGEGAGKYDPQKLAAQVEQAARRLF